MQTVTTTVTLEGVDDKRIQKELVDISDVKVPSDIPKINFYKNPGYYEIAVPLFERCNLSCAFCFESHKDNSIDYDKILNIPKNIIRETKEDIVKLKSREILFRIWGGEVFEDELPDEILDVYEELINRFKKEFSIIPVTLKFTFLSNGVFTKRDRVRKFLDRTNSHIDFSYDPIDRFSCDKQKEIWYNTLRFFLDKNPNVSITLTKTSIEKYISGDKYFEMIPETVGIDVNYYTANPGWERHLPTDDEVFSFFQYCLDNNKFNIFIIANMLKHLIPGQEENVERYCDCKFAVQYVDGKCTKDCAIRASLLPRKSFYGKYEKEINEQNVTEAKNSIGILKRGCLKCEHYKTCTMMCWISVIFEENKMTSCPIKRIYEYADKEDIQDYIEWEKKYG